MGYQIQRKRVLNLLRNMQFVPTYMIKQAASQYNARIYELRRMGFDIKSTWKDGKKGFLVPTQELLERIPLQQDNPPLHRQKHQS